MYAVDVPRDLRSREQHRTIKRPCDAAHVSRESANVANARMVRKTLATLQLSLGGLKRWDQSAHPHLRVAQLLILKTLHDLEISETIIGMRYTGPCMILGINLKLLKPHSPKALFMCIYIYRYTCTSISLQTYKGTYSVPSSYLPWVFVSTGRQP